MDGWWQLMIVSRRRKWLLAREDKTEQRRIRAGKQSNHFLKGKLPSLTTLEDWTWFFFFFFKENGHFLYNPNIACGSNKLPLWEANQKEINSSGNDIDLSNKKKLWVGFSGQDELQWKNHRMKWLCSKARVCSGHSGKRSLIHWLSRSDGFKTLLQC